jgi:cob(I)alamin adenosyltransferase
VGLIRRQKKLNWGNFSFMKQGFVQVYTGNGKGKTTAAIGLAIRAAGAGLKVYFCQFLKGKPSSEIEILKKINSHISIHRSGSKNFVIVPEKCDIECAQKCFQRVTRIIKKGEYDVVILDEINNAMAINLINSNELVNVILSKPKHVEIVLTGRNITKKIIKIADLVTEMKEIKHYYFKGIRARKGIEM